MEIQGHILEDFGFKAYNKGFFKEWQEKTTSASKEKQIPIRKACELVYAELTNDNSY